MIEVAIIGGAQRAGGGAGAGRQDGLHAGADPGHRPRRPTELWRSGPRPPRLGDHGIVAAHADGARGVGGASVASGADAADRGHRSALAPHQGRPVLLHFEEADQPGEPAAFMVENHHLHRALHEAARAAPNIRFMAGRESRHATMAIKPAWWRSTTVKPWPSSSSLPMDAIRGPARPRRSPAMAGPMGKRHRHDDRPWAAA